MGLFRRAVPVVTAELEAAARPVALATAPRPGGVTGGIFGTGIQRLAPAEFTPVGDVWSRATAMGVPSISRARDLICSAVGALPLTLWTYTWDPAATVTVERRVPPAGWMARPDPNRTRQYMLAWTCDDLLFYGRAYWHVTARYADTFPASFEWMQFEDVGVDANGSVRWGTLEVDPLDVLEFLSPIEGLLYTGSRAISTAVNLDNAAERFSFTEIPAGWLEQTENSEPLDADELATIAENFQAARAARTTAALNPFLRYREATMDPSRMQLVEARMHQRGDLANVANIPAYFVGAPQGTGMTYLNTAQAKSDLLDFGAMPYLQCVEQTLSGPNVVPHGQFVRLDTNAWLRNPFTSTTDPQPKGNDMQTAFNTPTEPVPPEDPTPPEDPNAPPQ